MPCLPTAAPTTLRLPPALAHLAARVAADPGVLAHVIAQHQRAERFTDADLDERLGCGMEALVRLRLCRVPTGEGEVRRVAEACGCVVRALERVLEVT